MDFTIAAPLQQAAMEKSVFTREYAVLKGLLRELREKANLTQEQVAEKLGQTQSFVSKCERGERRLDVVQLRAFGRAVGVTLPNIVAALEDRLGTMKR
jgi:transcriptional regulator with XRE-family HTH domain